ncbi:MAG TPA: LodA/GoxA family CTQ-dependent oxidase [Vicinamibacterales bacterium]|nr:LodA/GoxA family CTQ-dependent oxidase [Vicinamibacterales bacterium]
MDMIQFRVHPGVGMARFGPSTNWYFLGPEIPRFLQEQYPHLRHRPQPRRHPVLGDTTAAEPDENSYRDQDEDIMPQAARFRVFAYFFDRGSGLVYRVMEITTAHADIEWRIELACVKSVKKVGDARQVDPNTPAAVTLSTKTASPATNCRIGSLPNLAFLALEKGTDGKPNGRLHVIGNEGEETKAPGATFSELAIYQNGWQDPCADGTVKATIELKTAFTTQFSDYQYLSFAQSGDDGMALPQDRKVEALPASVVVNMPDYLPDMGHFVSLWDLAFAQARQNILDPKPQDAPDVVTVKGRHRLATKPADVSSYDWFDYFTHIHPLLGLFSDVAFVSGQVRAGAIHDQSFLRGVRVTGTLIDGVAAGVTKLKIGPIKAMRLKVASLGDPFLILLSEPDDVAPFLGKHELVLCTHVDDDGTLTVLRGQEATTDHDWTTPPPDYHAVTKAGSIRTKLAVDLKPDDVLLAVDMQSAFKMPLPLLSDDVTKRNGPFKIGIRANDVVEWMTCTASRRVPFQRDDEIHCNLVVTRGVDGTTPREWKVSDDPDIIATAIGHNKLDARARVAELSQVPGGGIAKTLFDRLRKPANLYARKTYRRLRFNNVPGAQVVDTPFPREFGRRLDFNNVGKPGESFDDAVNIDPAGSLARYHEVFVSLRGKACGREPLVAEPDTDVPPILDDETDPPEAKIWGTNALDHATRLDDYYWIVSEQDMPMLKEYALTEVQYAQFARWAARKVDFNPRHAPLFNVLFTGKPLEAFFKASKSDGTAAHTMEEYITALLTAEPLYAPAFLDMASMGKMLGGSFLPGIEVGREAGKPANWSLFQGGTKYFPDLRFMPQGTEDLHRPGMLTKDLAVPWFVDFVDCQENFWPTSRPQVVYQDNGLAYPWLPSRELTGEDIPSQGGTAEEEKKRRLELAMRRYWKRVGFIRRQDDGTLIEDESLIDRP